MSDQPESVRAIREMCLDKGTVSDDDDRTSEIVTLHGENGQSINIKVVSLTLQEQEDLDISVTSRNVEDNAELIMKCTRDPESGQKPFSRADIEQMKSAEVGMETWWAKLNTAVLRVHGFIDDVQSDDRLDTIQDLCDDAQTRLDEYQSKGAIDDDARKEVGEALEQISTATAVIQSGN